MAGPRGKLDVIELEVRKEGDNVAALANNLHCEVVAKATIQIDESHLKETLPKLVSRFRHSTTTNKAEVLNERFFKGPLTAKFKGAVEKIIGDHNHPDISPTASTGYEKGWSHLESRHWQTAQPEALAQTR